MNENREEQLSLEAAASNLLEECRMVLPGVQALFGFQFVAVFNQSFGEKLSAGERYLHLVALVCVACAAALVMSPAALHRLTQPKSVSDRFLAWSSRLLMWSMVPLAIGTSLDVYLVARIVTASTPISLACAAAVLIVFATLWYVVPRLFRRAKLST